MRNVPTPTYPFFLIITGVVLTGFFCIPRSQKTSGATHFSRWSEIARSVQPVTDKLTVHGYDSIYDVYFNQEVANRPLKFLEIGLGCGMSYGPGASAKIWPALFPHAEVWFAEYNEDCIKKYADSHNISWKYVTGDQEDIPTLNKWLVETAGGFDFIIDDGGHTNKQIWNTFQVFFFRGLKPGGVYFIEDIHVCRNHDVYKGGITGANGAAVIDVIAEWVDQLVVNSEAHSPKAVTRAYKHPLPSEIERIDCVKDMCAITKKKKG